VTTKHHKATILLEPGEAKNAVLTRLRKAGFTVEHHLDAIGAVTGSAPAAKIHKLKNIKGVKGVQVEQTYQLPPPDSSVQ
jgi:hypothetical protein